MRIPSKSATGLDYTTINTLVLKASSQRFTTINTDKILFVHRSYTDLCLTYDPCSHSGGVWIILQHSVSEGIRPKVSASNTA